jgi:hypothetical protein
LVLKPVVCTTGKGYAGPWGLKSRNDMGFTIVAHAFGQLADIRPTRSCMLVETGEAKEYPRR